MHLDIQVVFSQSTAYEQHLHAMSACLQCFYDVFTAILKEKEIERARERERGEGGGGEGVF